VPSTTKATGTKALALLQRGLDDYGIKSDRERPGTPARQLTVSRMPPYRQRWRVPLPEQGDDET
jgi:hypothetical protein